MKLAVFGATGKTGLHIVQQALDAGHEVVALVRNPSKMSLQHPKLTLIQGDALQSADVIKTLHGVDAVVNALGHVKGSPDHLQVTVITHILNAMKQHRIKRLVTLSGGGVRFPQDQPKFIDHVFKFLLKTVSPKVLADGEAHVKLIQQSDVEWIVVRAPRLTDNAHTKQYKTGFIGDDGMSTQCSRANVADFMLKCVTDQRWVKQGPFISE